MQHDQVAASTALGAPEAAEATDPVIKAVLVENRPRL
jgi:hypothetical protein